MMEKLKVLIVDDEYLIRNLLRLRIDWEQQGMTIIGEASNAGEALELIDNEKPDIIFTDICMPFMDGIEFSGMVLEKHPEIKIIVVTGHDEFEYARRSLKLGVIDFILKPIRASELLSVTDKVKSKIYEERSRDQEMEKLKEELERNLPYLKEKFLNQCLMGALSLEEIHEKANYFKIPVCLGEGLFQIAVIEVSSAFAEQTEEQMILLKMKCRNKAEAFFQADSKVIVLLDTKNQIVIISFNQDADFVSDCELLKANLVNAYPCFINIGIGRKYEHIQEVHLGYQEASRALQYKAFVGKNQVVYFEDVIDNKGEQYHSNSDLLQKLQFYISVGSSEGASQIVSRIFDVSFSSVSQFRIAAMDVITECQHAAIEQQIENEFVFDKETLVSILTADNLPELKKTLANYVLSLSGAICSKNQAKEGNLISQVKDYLENNMSDPELGLASTAAVFFVSPGHLGRLMKKEIGQTFVEYLTNIRMKRAETLLKTTDLKGYQVGEKVGITDPHYFSILFKKTIGRSVNEYRSSK